MHAKSKRTLTALCALGLMLAAAAGARAQETSGQDDASGEAPPPPSANTRQEFGQTITEYERHGDVYLMTVKPRVGPTQYWNDPDGDGQFQRQNSDDLDENVNLPKWRLGGW